MSMSSLARPALSYLLPAFCQLTPCASAEIQPGGKLDGKLSIILRLAPQNWHISSASLAEVALAVGKLSPSSFWKASLALFEQQPQFLNVLAQELTSRQIREKAAEGTSPRLFLTTHCCRGSDFVSPSNGLPTVVIQAVPELKGQDLTALTANVFAEGGLGQNGPSSVTADLQYNGASSPLFPSRLHGETDVRNWFGFAREQQSRSPARSRSSTRRRSRSTASSRAMSLTVRPSTASSRRGARQSGTTGCARTSNEGSVRRGGEEEINRWMILLACTKGRFCKLRGQV